MNLRSMPELGVSFGQEWALGLMATIVVVILRVFRRRGWL
jgi:Mg2+ and Co2+ transporter CorA